ncbi:hypothetical protein F3Y22_tig00110365pilonHSYRG00006 [Hibiscus syriacus]|uniref:Integrase catalytic domain-containing protein n=1 Tax=Hibiscus syriacus TaxID=106335 RepID=A0A6A3AYA6_HIBSY|nr:hypothetical protein F3Y22_tig00110365pilonHSYRG00006 [Hibiscus syriacus]
MATKFDIEKFNGRNFSLWKLKMKAILRKDGCLAAINERPVDFADNIKWNEMDENAMENFHLALADEVLSSIEEKKTAKEIWDHLIKLYEATSLHNKIFLKRKLYTLQRAELLLQSLPDSYDQLIINLTNSNVTSLVFDDVATAVLQEESRRKNKEDRQVNLQQAEALTTMRGRSTERGQSSSHKHGRSKSMSKKNLKCYHCGKKASTTVEGRKRFAYIWLIDSRATYHMTSRIEWFHHYEPVSGGSVYSCNDHALEIIGVGTIKLKMYDGTIKVVRDVFRGALVVLKGENIVTNLYMLKGETLLEAEASVASCSSDSAMLWHKKLGHMSEQGMKVLVEQKLLPGLTKVSLPLCEHCITITSLGGAKYFVSFIDDYSRRCWVHPIKKKSDVFSTFKNFKARVELDSGNKIKCFRTDNGGEYTSDKFDDFCRKEGIKRQFTVANTPQQNGVAERMNRTLLERTRAMLRDACLEKSFWAEAVNTAVIWKCKFLGYADGVKGYHLWDPTARKVIISRDVIFVEDKLQSKEDDDSAEKSETTQIHVEKEVEQGDSSEAEPAHDEQEPESFEAPTTRQSDRVRRRLNWHSDYVIEGNITYFLLTEDGEPSTYQEAINSSYASLWMMAMQEEIEALHKNNTWDLVPLPQGRKPIGNKWVFKIKRNGDDQVERYRARLVVKGYAQKEGIDFNEIFSPVVRLTTVRVVLAICATLNLHLEQLDVKTAFLHGNLEEEIYMLQPEGFEEDEKKNLVCRLNKSLYGLKQAPRCWYKRFDSFIMCLGYNRLNADPCAYFKRSGDNDFVILLLYVDDMLVAGPNKDHIEELKAQLAREFEMKDLGSANKILGMQIHRDRSNRKIWLSQKNYLKKILSRFNMQDCKPISTPLPINFKLSSSMSPSSEEERMEMSRVPYASAMGSLMFAMICTRQDIAQAVGVVSRYMANPGKEHWNTVKRILRYIKGTSNVALFAGGAVSWVSKLKSVVATSTTEAEYVAATQASKEAIWLKMLLEELGHNQEYVSLFCDSQSALHLARNPAFHSMTKHIRVQYHFIREKVEEGTVDIQKIHTKDNIADFMKKAINADKFTWCRSSCGLSETCDFALSDSRLPQQRGSTGCHLCSSCHILDRSQIGAPICFEELMDHDGNWERDKLEQFLPSAAANRIMGILPPSPSAGDDCCVWHRNPGHKFSVDSAYCTLVDSNWDAVDSKLAAVWTAPIPQRIQSILHVLRDCPAVSSIWESILPPGLWTAFFSMSLTDWITSNLQSKVKLPGMHISWSIFFPTFSWHVWKRRNCFVFTDNGSSIHGTLNVGLAWSKHFEGCSLSTNTSNARHLALLQWKPPSHVDYCLNTDASIDCRTGFATAGVKALQIQSDSYQAIQLLLDPNACSSTLPLVNAITSLCARSWYTEFVWVPREENMVADGMAKLDDVSLHSFHAAPDSILLTDDRDVQFLPMLKLFVIRPLNELDVQRTVHKSCGEKFVYLLNE